MTTPQKFGGYSPEELKKLCDAATKGPWTIGEPMEEYHEFNTPILLPMRDNGITPAVAWARVDIKEVADNAAFISAARNALPYLLAALEAAQKESTLVRGWLNEACIEAGLGPISESLDIATCNVLAHQIKTIRDNCARFFEGWEAAQKRVQELEHEKEAVLATLRGCEPYGKHMDKGLLAVGQRLIELTKERDDFAIRCIEKTSASANEGVALEIIEKVKQELAAPAKGDEK